MADEGEGATPDPPKRTLDWKSPSEAGVKKAKLPASCHVQFGAWQDLNTPGKFLYAKIERSRYRINKDFPLDKEYEHELNHEESWYDLSWNAQMQMHAKRMLGQTHAEQTIADLGKRLKDVDNITVDWSGAKFYAPHLEQSMYYKESDESLALVNCSAFLPQVESVLGVAQVQRLQSIDFADRQAGYLITESDDIQGVAERVQAVLASFGSNVKLFKAEDN
jgi:hypothetical protein